MTRGSAGSRRTALGWFAALLAVLALGALLAVVGHARPAYDAFGWLVWGHQILHGTLNLDGAPSWKPLTFLFTLPYSLFAQHTAMWLWIVTACAGGVAGPLMAGRVAWRLAPRGAGWMPSWLPPLVAALIACGATASMTVAAKSTPTTMGLLRQILIVTSDPLVLALWLGAIDSHLSRRYRWALALIWLTALGRPEAWIFLAGYALWLFLKVPRMRVWAVLSIVIMPVAWFLAPALASHSWMSAGNLDLNQPTALHGNKIVGVANRVRTLTGTTLQIEVAASILLVALRRNWTALSLVGLAAVWTIVEIAFALHGWSSVQRYMVEAGGALAVVGGVGAAHALTWPALKLGERLALPLSLAGIAAVVVFAIAVEPFVHWSVDGAHAEVSNQKLNTAEFNGLNKLIAETSVKKILACGAPASGLGWQSGLAWQLGEDVGSVGFASPSDYKASGRSVVYFSRDGVHWKITLINTPASLAASCASLNGLSS